ncbi:MAG: hypothetical protein LAO51_08780 [Acidobacteriia bacterium]|nr:hypothetical protein [Terriglobia bacterium]
MRRSALVLAVGLIALPVLAQESPSYKLKESVFNAGGHPKDGVVLASASFRVTLDSAGEGVVAVGVVSVSFHMDGSFMGGYPPPGEVYDFLFSDKTTMAWDSEKSTGTYNVYRDLMSNLSGGGFGTCFAQGLTQPAGSDPNTPPVNNGWFYLVTAENRLREEGTNGFRSSGAERGNPAPCP